MKIALVHDYLVQYGGAERVLECFCELFPYAPIYTLVHDKEVMRGKFSDKRIYTSFLQKLPFAKRQHRLFPLLMPMAMEQFDFSRYDVVLSDSSSYAKGVITHPRTLHVCYMHTPMRYAWDDCQRYTQEFHFPSYVKRFVPFAMNYIRLWDRVSAERPDHIIANSKFVQDRIQKYYHRSSDIIHPPVDTRLFTPSEEEGGYYLMVGRLIAYKRHDIVIEAFNKSGKPLKIIGRGPELNRLKKRSGSNIEFLERVSDSDLPEYYRLCRAFLFPQEEDFGIVAVEALASGRPVIAFRGGDVVRHVTEGKTGVFFDTQTPEALQEAIDRFETYTFSPDTMRAQAMRFDREVFKKSILNSINTYLKQKTRNGT